MIKANFDAYNSYVTDSLYQWDLNQVLTVTGLNLVNAPEIHFSNVNMDRAIVRQATMENHIVKVGIPNSLLQEPFTIEANIGIYEGDTFKVIEKISIPVKPKKRPNDYQIQGSDEEIYSFKKLENDIAKSIVTFDNKVKDNNELINARVDNLLSAKGLEATEIELLTDYGDEYLSIDSIKAVTNGVVAMLIVTGVNRSGSMAVGNIELFKLPDELTPFDNSLYIDGDKFNIDVGSDNIARIGFNASVDNEDIYHTYNLANPYIYELIDSRLGADGNVHASVGEAVREQVKSLKNELSNYSFINDIPISINPKDFSLITNSTNGSILYENNGIAITGGNDSSQKTIALLREHGGAYKLKYTDITANPSYISYSLLPFYRVYDDIYCIRFMGSSIRLQKYNVSTFSGASLEEKAISYTPTTNDELMLVCKNNVVYLYVNNILLTQFNYADEVSYDGAYCCGLIWIYFVTTQNDKPLISDVSCYTVEKKSERIINNNTKYYHMSIDDVIQCFEDITENADNYDSIFENEFFAWCKNIHDMYGTTFSCYCFYLDNEYKKGWTLDDCTTKFADEFTKNSDWLRFGFHSYAQGYTYSSDSRESNASEDYNAVISALVNITGSVDCIDRMPRLQSYIGTLTALKELRDCDCGCVGFLTSKDDSIESPRDSYYFDEETNNYINKHYKYYDFENQLLFVKTSLASGYDIADMSDFRNNVKWVNANKYVELFTHESQLSDTMKSFYATRIGQLANTHKPYFSMDLLV